MASRSAATGRLKDVYIAQVINRFSGGAVIAPWDVHSLPDDWLDIVPALTHDYSQARAGIQKIEDAKARYLAPFRKH